VPGSRFASITAGLALVPALAVAGCSDTSLTTEDAYKIGCPAIDATAATGSVASDVAVSTLKEVRDRAHPSAETKKWLNAAIAVLTSDEPSKASRQVRQVIIQGCRRNGYPLQNLK
jgi:hypothetical protein